MEDAINADDYISLDYERLFNAFEEERGPRDAERTHKSAKRRRLNHTVGTKDADMECDLLSV
jgi:hypothetical protein